MIDLVSIFCGIFRKKFRLLILSWSCEMYVLNIFIGSMETFFFKRFSFIVFN